MRRAWPVVTLAAVLAAGIATVALLAPHDAPTGVPQVRTSYFASTGEICDVRLTPYLATPRVSDATALALWRLSTLDLNALPLDPVSTQDVGGPTADTELAAVGRAVTRDLEETLGATGFGAVDVRVGVASACRTLPRANESGEPVVEVAAALAGRVPTGLMSGADLERFIVTTSGTVCEIALRLGGPPDSTDPGVLTMRTYLAGLDLATLAAPSPDLIAMMTGEGESRDHAEASAWLSQISQAAFAPSEEFGLNPSGMSTEGTARCDP